MSWLNPLLPLLGVIVGASLQFWFSRFSEERRGRHTLRSQAYVDFIKAVSSLAAAQRQANQTKIDDALLQLTDAKARIVVYGSKDVAVALAEFQRQGARLHTEGIRSFIRLCERMRAEQKADPLSEHDISTILFELPPKSPLPAFLTPDHFPEAERPRET